MKFYAPKIGLCESPVGKLGFAFAGNSNFATAAVQKCSALIQTLNDADLVIPEIEKILDRQYRKTVYAHPDRTTDWSLHYSLLFAYWHPSRGTFLFATHETTMRSIVDFECIGLGRELARYLVTPTYDALIDEGETSRLASYMLSRVKDYVPGCGGPSKLLAIRNDGTTEWLRSAELHQLEEASEAFDRAAQSLFFTATSSSDARFDVEAERFCEWLKTKRDVWRFERDLITPPDLADLQSTTSDLSPSQPSQESRGESGES